MLATRTLRPGGKKSKPNWRLDGKLADEARFIRTWLDSPLKTGAVSPSGRFLARAMARNIDPNGNDLVVELGPGTGPVTEALLARGVAPERLVLVEYESSFCRLLERRFPRARIVKGDAYNLADTLRETLRHQSGRKIGAIVSSLPLLTKPDRERLALLESAFALMGQDGLFVQFTYGVQSPIPLKMQGSDCAYHGDGSQPVWLNLPPARVWCYRHRGARGQPVVPLRRAEIVNAKMAPALSLLRKFADSAKIDRR